MTRVIRLRRNELNEKFWTFITGGVSFEGRAWEDYMMLGGLNGRSLGDFGIWFRFRVIR